MPVVRPVKRKDGTSLGHVAVGDEVRSYVLLEFAPGAPKPDMSEDDCRGFGEAIGAIHAESNSFESSEGRYRLDLRYLLHEPLDRMEEVLSERDLGDLSSQRALLAPLEERIRSLPEDGDEFGIIHADLHLRNVHFDDSGRMTILDFDHCAYGWRAYDLATCQMALNKELWPAFLEGYRVRRVPSDEEMDAIPTFQRLRMVWDAGDMLAMQPVWGTTDVADRYAGQIKAMLAEVI